MPERFASGIADNTAKQMVGLLNDNLAPVIDLTLAAKQAHWNIKGPNFIGIHLLLDDVIGRLREISDTIAERAVILGGIPKGTAQTVADDTGLEPYPAEETDINACVRALTDRYKEVAKMLRSAIDKAGEAGDEDTADIFTEASRIVDKDAWFIGANVPAK
ncbi:DNA starvation/stationary phase protection protein Dps [Aquicoccus sp. G2-2]|jgi:starvation-inducible DNA-binding protein|uniref:DNA starvation/stationary phase protection protein Dps n=1 Tax=Aquicoccus sp. G2-2 TaxID=3092120 RepID=UPI002ADF7406|nr:DNA starvation/stationary phase protection protein Dps [Aquicoccus sp. G2-2]MEA1113514.1 DNA starvation/stationary phase protection protein Dps [Aquicoccus sp. G2-2]